MNLKKEILLNNLSHRFQVITEPIRSSLNSDLMPRLLNSKIMSLFSSGNFLIKTPALTWSQCYKTCFSSLLPTRPNKLECLHLAKIFQSSLTFAGSTRSLPKKATSERSTNWVYSGLALKF
jgi:hypothetical protein